MENRLELNKRPVYELPDEVLIDEYIKRPDIKRCKTPNFKPDLCLSIKYDIKVSNCFDNSDQIWIKTENKDLIGFVKGFNFNSKIKATNIKNLCIWRLKKIILEEFYGVNNGLQSRACSR